MCYDAESAETWNVLLVRLRRWKSFVAPRYLWSLRSLIVHVVAALLAFGRSNRGIDWTGNVENGAQAWLIVVCVFCLRLSFSGNVEASNVSLLWVSDSVLVEWDACVVHASVHLSAFLSLNVFDGLIEYVGMDSLGWLLPSECGIWGKFLALNLLKDVLAELGKGDITTSLYSSNGFAQRRIQFNFVSVQGILELTQGNLTVLVISNFFG